MAFGPHLIYDGYLCERDRLVDLNLIFDFLDKLPERIGMTKIDQPKVFKYSGMHPEDWGVTGTVILAESHCSIHTFPDRDGFVTIDVYSCKDFDAAEVIRVIELYFLPNEFDVQVLERGAKFCRPISPESAETQLNI